MPIIEMPDGVQVEFPDTMSDTQIRGLIAQRYPREVGAIGAAKPPAERITAGHSNFDSPTPQPSRTTAMLSGGVEGIPIAGPYLQSGVENAAAYLGSKLTGEDHAKVRGEMGGMVDQSQAEYPWSTMGAGALVGTASLLPAMAAAPGAFGVGGGSLLGRTGMSALSGAAIGGADAGVRSDFDPMAMARGAGIGGALGAIGPAAGDLIGAGVRKFTSYFGGGTPAEQNFARAAAADNVDNVGSSLDNLGPDAMPMDLGPNLQRQAGALAASPGEGQQIIRSALTDRQSGAGGRVAGALDDTLGQNVDTLAMADEISTRQSAAAKPLYDAAYSKPVPFTQDLEELLTRPSAAKALRKAQSLAADEGIPSQQWFANVADDGGVSIKNVPDVRQLDLTKRALDDMIDVAKRAGSNNEARIYMQMKDRLVGMIDDAVPEYKQARAAYAGPAAVKDAMEEGGAVFNDAMTPNQLRTRMMKMGDAEKEAFVQGARAQVADIMGTARNDALAARSMFQKGYNKEKLAILLGEDEAVRLLKSLDAETAFTKTRDVVTGNSETAARQAAQKEIAPGGSDSFIRNFDLSKPGDFVARIGDKLASSSREQVQGTTNAELARLLTSKDPEALTRTIKMVQAAQRRGDITAARAKEIVQALSMAPQTRRPLEITVTPRR